MGIARFIPILPCNLQRFWARVNVTAPGSTVVISLYKWNGGADELVAPLDMSGQAAGQIYWGEIDVSSLATRFIDPLPGMGFYLLTDTINATLLEIGIEYKLTDRRLIP